MAERHQPLSVWPVAQQPSRTQRRRRYLLESEAHPAKMLPALARHAIEAYTSPGDTVVDPMSGIGTSLVEAVYLGRDAVGVEYEAYWATLARANLAFAREQGAPGHGETICGDGRYTASLIDPALRGLVALVLTSPPYGPSLHGRVETRPGRGITKRDNRYSRDRQNLAHVCYESLLEAMRQILIECTRLLRPSGIVVVTARPWRRAGLLIDLPGDIVRVAERAGLVLFERNVALLAGVRNSDLVPRASFFALQNARKVSPDGPARLVIAHEDVLVFRWPGTSSSSGMPAGPQRGYACSARSA